MQTKNIVIIGGGAGGLELAVGLAKKLNSDTHKVVLVDKEKTHMWKPHLHEVSAGKLNSSSEEVSYLNLAYRFGFEFVWGEMSELNRELKTVGINAQMNVSGEEILPHRTIAYDNLVIAIGSSSNDFGTPGVKQYAYSLDDLSSANKFHESMLESVLKKEHNAAMSEPLSITIVGGGATGVELAAELTQTTRHLANFGLNKLKSKPVKITVVNAGPQLLPGLSDKISNGAKVILEEAGVQVMNSAKVIEIRENSAIVEYQGKQVEVAADLQVWAAGVKSPEFLGKLGLEANRGNQLVVNGQLQTSDPYIFAIGDCASAKWIGAPKEGSFVPPRAQSAHQMSDYLIKNLIKIGNGEKVAEFVYKDFGSLVSLGSGETVGTLMGFLQGKSLFVEGKIAKMMYIHLYQHHQIKINGFIPAFFLMLGKLIQKRFKPTVKLH